MTARRIFYIDDMHKKYGPVVLISPNEVSFTSPEVFNEVHKIGNGYLKSDWYTKFRPGGPPDVFAVIDPKIHAFKRRLLARPFSLSSLRTNWEDLVISLARQAVQKIKMEAECGTACVFKWFTLMTTDIIGEIAFGEPFNMVKTGEVSAVSFQLFFRRVVVPKVCKVVGKDKLQNFHKAEILTMDSH